MRRPSGFHHWPKVLGMLAASFACGVATPADADEERQATVELVGTVVDEAKAPVSGATVVSFGLETSEPVKTAADGRFRIEIPETPTGRIYTSLRAAGQDDRIGLLHVSQEKPESVTIVLKPARSIALRVLDRDGTPVEGAEVGFLASLHLLDEGRTDAQGRWHVKVAEDAKAWGLYALKAKAGFDYAFAERARGSAEPPLPLPEQLTLTLDGARAPLRVKAVDQDGKPLADVQMGPWLITKPGHEAEANLSGLSRTWPKTGQDGVVTFDWLPEQVMGSISILSRSTAYYPVDHATGILGDKPVNDLTITLLPLERLSGRVTTRDGRPAAGVKLDIQGQGGGSNHFRGVALTGADGRYSCRVYSEHAYIITASKDDLAAPYKSGVVVRAGKPVEGADLTLVPATRVRGRVTAGKDRKPVAATSVQAVINKGSIPDELKRAGDRYHRGMTLYHLQQTDNDGRFEFVLGPGEYTLQGPARVEPVKLTIPLDDPPAELVHDFAMPRPETGPFKATVVDADGKPVASAVVDGAYAAQTGRWFSPTKSDAKGAFTLIRSLDPLVLHVETPDKRRAGMARVDAEAAEARIVVTPAATATGRLVDPEGKPLAGRKLSYGIRIYQGPKRTSPFSWRFGGSATSDDQGRFICEGLVVGETYEIHITLEDDRSSRTAATKIAPKDPGTLALGDVSIDLSPYKPYVPPTPAEQTGRSFASRKEKSAQEKREYVLTEAKREYTRPLLLFGGPKEPACVDLFRLFEERSDAGDAAQGKPRVKSPADLRWEFELASLDTAEADVPALAKELGVPLGDAETPMLAVLSEDGKLAATYPLRLGTDKALDAGTLGAFLLEHKLPTRDAEAMLADGFAKAKSEDKRVFLIMSASWCGPCRMLARFLAANKAELERHYVFVKLDVSRDDHAETLRKRYKGAESGGVPWYVILDARGEPLITSNAKALEEEEEGANTNIGFPSSKEGIDHFAKMLKQTAPRLADGALATLRDRLSKKP